jgi:hypothetical protein
MRLVRLVRFVLVGAAIAALSIAPTAAQGERKQPAKMEQAQRQEAQALVTLVDDFAQGKSPSTALPITWEQNHYIKALADKTYVPFTVGIQPGALGSASVGVYMRVVAKGTPAVAPPPADTKKKDKKAEVMSQYAFEDLFFTDVPAAAAGQPQRVRRAFAVPPGDYEVYVAVKERSAAGAQGAAPKAGVLKHDISAPDLSGRELTTSSIIVAQSVDMVSAGAQENQAEHPYTFGQMKIEPAIDAKFSKKGELSVLFWIYGAKNDAGNKPDVSLDFKFYQKAEGKETYFNKTEPQALNAQTLPPQFDLAAGHQLMGSLAVPLASFPEGDYRLEIEVQDKLATQKITREVAFSVTGQ